MNNTIFYLIGHPDLPRRAVADAIAARTGARIVDAEDIYRLIFPLVGEEPADMPDAVWEQVDAVRGAILKTIETMSPRDWNFVFIHAGFDIPPDVEVYRTVRDLARRRGSRFLPVRLTGGAGTRPLMAFDEADALAIDLDATAATNAAARIVAAAGG